VFTATAQADVAARFEKLRGDAQQAYVGQTVAIAPAVRLTDRFGNAIASAPVTFNVAAGGGSITGASTSTDASGVAGVGSWTVGTTRGTQSLAATSGGFATSFTATAMSREPQRMVQISTLPYSAGQTVAPSVKVLDDAGAPVPDVVVTFSLPPNTPTTNSPSSTLVGPVATTDEAGIARAGSWTVGNLGTYRLVASSPGIPDLAMVANVVLGGSASRFAIEKTGATIPTFQVRGFFGNWKVEPMDGYGNHGIGVSRILVTSSDALGTHRSEEFDVGSSYAIVGWGAGCAIGTQTLTVYDVVDSIPTSSRSFTVSAGPPQTLIKVTGDNQTAPAGTALSVTPSVRVVDVCDNPLKGITVTFTTQAAAGTVTQSVVTGTDGIATLAGWVLPATPGTYSSFATAQGGAFPRATFTAAATAPPN
jgi:adhesin/invasin